MKALVKILKWVGGTLLVLALLVALAYAVRRDPWGPIAGRELTGEVVPEAVQDWSFTDAYNYIAVETRPDEPHSVTTICIALDGELYVPAMNGSEKQWTQYVLDDPRVRIKVGDKLYPGRAVRVTGDSLRKELREAARKKYNFEDRENEPQDVWLFRIDSVGAAPAGSPTP